MIVNGQIEIKFCGVANADLGGVFFTSSYFHINPKIVYNLVLKSPPPKKKSLSVA